MRLLLLAGLLTVPFVAASCEGGPDVNAESSSVEAPTAPTVVLDIEGMT